MGGFNFGPYKQQAGGAGRRAAIIAGLPSSEIDAAGMSARMDFNDRTSGIQEQVKQMQAQQQMQALQSLFRIMGQQGGFSRQTPNPHMGNSEAGEDFNNQYGQGVRGLNQAYAPRPQNNDLNDFMVRLQQLMQGRQSGLQPGNMQQPLYPTRGRY